MSQSQPFLSKMDLFEPNTRGYWHYRIPGLVTLASGTVLAYCEAREGEGHDWDPIDIYMRRSADNGVTWGPARKVVDRRDYGGGTMNNPSCIVDHDTGSVHLLFCHDYSRAYYMRSDDAGASFSEPVEITSAFGAFRQEYDWGILAVGPGHGIQMRNGRLVAPVWLSESKTRAHRPNRAAVIYSDDHGASWHAGDLVPPTVANCNETEAVEMADGSVLLNMRNMGEERRRAITESLDGASDWQEPWLDRALLAPRCFGSICRYSWPVAGSRDRILFSNPDNLRGAEGSTSHGLAERRNVTIRMSYDGCGSWPVTKSVERGPSGYSDLSVSADGTILLFYERRPADEPPGTWHLTLARLNLEWLTDGADHP